MSKGAFNPNTLLLAGGLIILGLVATFAGYYTSGSTSDRPEASRASVPTPPARGVVQSVTSESLTLTSDAGTRTLRVTSSTMVESLRLAGLNTVRPGDWVNAGAVPHQQTLLALTGLVILPDGAYEAPSR